MSVVMFESRLEAAQGRRYMGIWKKRVSGGMKNMCKGPEVGVCLRYLGSYHECLE